MQLDARRLLDKTGEAFLVDVIKWGAPGWPHTPRVMTPASGFALITIGAASCRIDARCIRTIRVDNSGAAIQLDVPSPVPDHGSLVTLPLSLVLQSDSWELLQNGPFDWFRDQAAGRRATANSWIGDSHPVIQRLRGSGDDPFPLQKLGVAMACKWPPFAFGKLGLFASAGQVPRAALAFIPAGEYSGNEKEGCSGPPLYGHKGGRLGADNAWTMAPVVLAFPLARSPDAGTPADIAWRVLVNWRPLLVLNALKINRLRAKTVIDEVWNEVVRAMLKGHRVVKAAQPWLALPTMELVASDAGEDNFTPQLVFDVSRRKHTAARLSRVSLNPKQPAKFNLRFDWQADAVVRDGLKQPLDLAGSGFALEATLETTGLAASWTSVPTPAEMPALLQAALAGGADGAELASWTFGVTKAVSDAPSDWIALGSLEISLLGNDGKQIPQEGSSVLNCRIRGDWTDSKRDLYPETDLRLDCRVRVSSLQDAGNANLDAALDAVNAQEERLHRDTEALRHAIGGEWGRLCTLRIRHKSEPGRNALVEMSIHSKDRSPLGSSAFYFQARPFTVAKVEPSQIDDQAGELIAIWRSDDVEGVQWRLPDTTLSFAFPPQAVGEEMERGNRFWSGGKSHIDPTRPLRYRFSPPTRLVVRPSVLPRRYNKSPSNLSQALQGAKVDSFSTEMAYPVQAEFKVSELGDPDVRIAETAAFLGRPTVNLPLPPIENGGTDDTARHNWARTVLSEELAGWALRELAPPARWDALIVDYRQLRGTHSASRANFAARLAQFHLYDPHRKDGGLNLSDGLAFRIRGTRLGAPALLNPLPTSPASVDLLDSGKLEIAAFLEHGDWAEPGASEANGALRAGVLHTIEFPSELVSILRNPVATSGSIDSLAFTALGASGQFSASFDEGRSTFIVETRHGQVSRLIKVRIGRIALLWNRAKHIIVYERTTYPTEQFKDEQPAPGDTAGWPILRKTAEYVEPIDVIRDFASEAQKDVSRTGFVEASEFVSKRIYVNGAWGRDLGHGYELPLWNRADTSGFYPKPQLALRMQAGGDTRSRCWLDKPEHLYFYSNTEVGTGGEPDRWDAKNEVDCPKGPARLPVFTGMKLDAAAVLGTRALPDPRLGAAERPRFDLATVSDGAVNLLHGRAESHMLVALHVVSMARTDEDKAYTEAPHGGKTPLDLLADGSNAAATLASIQQRIGDVLARLPQRMLESGLDCTSLKTTLHREIDAAFDDVGKRIADISKLDLTQMAGEWANSVKGKVQQSVGQLKFGASNAIRIAFELLRKDVKDLQAAALGATDDQIAEVRQTAHGRLETLRGDVRGKVGEAVTLFERQEKLLEWRLATATDALLTQLATAVEALDTSLDKPALIAQLKAIATHAENLRVDLAAERKTPALAPVVDKVSQVLAQIEQIVAGAEDWVEKGSPALQARLRNMVDQLRATLGQASAALAAISDAVTQAKDPLVALAAAFDARAGELQALLDTAADAIEVRAVLAQWVAAAEQVFGTTEDALVQALNLKIAAIDTVVAKEAQTLIGPLVALADEVQNLSSVARASATTWLGSLHKDATTRINDFDCSEIDKARKQLEEVLQRAEAQVRERVTDALASVVDEATLTRLDALAGLGNKVGKGIKLAKALGDMPQLPTLSFNAERAEYVFEDLKHQIDTSPFASRLREIDSGLKELGLAVPARQLLDQIIPDRLKDIDFSKIFNNLGGIDFQDLFKRFRLPELSNDKIKITHGLDKATRSAWVKTAVNADFPQEQTLFEFASVAVRIARMELRANNDIRVSADGQRRAITDGRFTGDWGLDFGGARMATFKEVTVRFDGSGFDFDVSPDKVQLHPSLKFIQEYAKQFQDKLPPAVQVEKDARGVPVGVRASFSTVVDKLPPIPPVTIGPILIASGLGLRMNRDGVFEISTHVALGSKTAPVFVQVSYLGGGFWLEASCTAKGSKVEPKASLGLALGSMRAFNLAGVARGSYSILLFANAEIDSHGGSLHAGMTIEGSARILGIANASVRLLLEVEHQSGGGTTARGRLDVEIEICWCYTLEVHTAAEHKL